MASQAGGYSPAPERFRDYLLLLARASLGGREAALLAPSDMVQQALLEAVRKRELFRGQSDAELAGWLRQILACTITDALRARGRAKRDVARERSLEAAIEESSARVEAWLAAEQSAPIERAGREEDLLRLTQALAQLPEDQRRAVELKHLHGQSVADIAEVMGRTETAVGGLLRRGMTHLRELLRHESG
jgi:RNA polymerase sigma-70 factor (ECF subfamily)